MEKKKALVLSGGSIKGAFQAGAIMALTDAGHTFDAIYGISVGSLNGTFLSNEIGKSVVAKRPINWELTGRALVKFWENNIKEPKDVVRKRTGLGVVGGIAVNNFNGLVDTEPLHKLLLQTVDTRHLAASPVPITVGAVNLHNGNIIYANANTPNFLDYVMASSAIPIVMPVVKVGGENGHYHLDGGVRDVAPLKMAIRDAVTEIVCITCHTPSLGIANFDQGNLKNLAERVMEMVVNEIVNNDIEWAEYFNRFLPEDGSVETQGPLEGFRKVKLGVIRPVHPIELDLEEFTEADIKKAIQDGYARAQVWLKGAPGA